MPGRRQAISPFPCRVARSLARSHRNPRGDPRGGKARRGGEGRVCPRAEDRFPDRQRQVMASLAMGSQAYRFTGRDKTSLDYVSRSVREGPTWSWLAGWLAVPMQGGQGKFSRRRLMVTSIGWCTCVRARSLLHACLRVFIGSVAFETERRVRG